MSSRTFDHHVGDAADVEVGALGAEFVADVVDHVLLDVAGGAVPLLLRERERDADVAVARVELVERLAVDQVPLVLLAEVESGVALFPVR